MGFRPGSGEGPTPGSITQSIEIGDSFVVGGSGNYADSDHGHAFPAPAAGYVNGVLAAVAADGSSTAPMRADAKLAHTAAMHEAGGHADLSSYYTKAVDYLAHNHDARYTRLAWFDVRAYGAVIDGVTADSAAIQAAIDACNTAGGGIVWCPPGRYRLNAAVTLKSGVILKGAQAPVGWVFGNTSMGTVFVPDAGGLFDAVTSPLATQILGSGIIDIAFDGAVATANWLVRLYASAGLILRNVAIRQYSTGANGIYLDGGNSGTYQALVDHVSANCGGGFTGGTALLLGKSTGPFNANTIVAPEIQGYVKGIDNAVGGGNTFVNPWLQYCGTGIRLASSQCLILGGWYEQNTVESIKFEAGSVNNTVLGGRNAGQAGTAVMVTKGGSGNVCRDVEGFNRTGAQNIALGGPSPITYTNVECLPVNIFLWGGTITSVTKNGVALPNTGSLSIPLEPGEAFTFAYTATPNFVLDRK